ncbi:uncharacterized protein LOC143901930 [Temnothorax americanus]|uniref:uncharacterized protein LOC143901930 n=1 Tax=Temnothorax americanus TaxID=1964332 RepID=UPI0040694DB7
MRIMPHCIAPGCTFGYKSNPEVIHFFAVPKDRSIINLWQNAIRRKDFVVWSGQFLCEKHFLAEDILWKRELRDSDGQVLGVSYYKQPRLRKGTVPSQFPWTEISIPLQDTSLQETAQNPVHDVSQHCIQENLQEAMSDEPPKFSFTDLVACTTLRVPVNWSRRTVICDGIKIESFVTVTCIKIENNFVTVNIKELVVQENLNLKINIMCKPFDATSFGICSDTIISSIEDVETTLNTLELWKICCGASAANNVITYGSNAGLWHSPIFLG